MKIQVFQRSQTKKGVVFNNAQFIVRQRQVLQVIGGTDARKGLQHVMIQNEHFQIRQMFKELSV